MGEGEENVEFQNEENLVTDETVTEQKSEVEELEDRYKRLLAEFENYKKRSPPPPHDPTQERPYFQSYDWKSIENNEPTFVKRPKIDRKQLRKKVESQPLYKERKVKHLPQPEPVPIPHVEKKKIKNVIAKKNDKIILSIFRRKITWQ